MTKNTIRQLIILLGILVAVLIGLAYSGFLDRAANSAGIFPAWWTTDPVGLHTIVTWFKGFRF